MQCFRIALQADVQRIEALAYDQFMAHASLADALEDAAQRHADRSALTFVEDAHQPALAQRWTHREFAADVRRAANLFHRLAGSDEARVAFLLPAIPQAYFALFGAEIAGLACPINYLLDTEHIAELIQASQANVLVALGPNATLEIWSRVGAVRGLCPGLKHVLVVGNALGNAVGDADGDVDGAAGFDAAMRAERGDALQFNRRVHATTLAALFHTGGTTGRPSWPSTRMATSSTRVGERRRCLP